MIEVLQFTDEQRNDLRGSYNGEILDPVKDGLGRWIVGLEVLDNSAFEAINNQLNSLDIVVYIPLSSESISSFYGYALIATESIMQTYPELPYKTDANGTTVLKWDIVYDDAYNYALPVLLTLEKIKYKPIP